ncbi:MAG: M23 family metallopeptidase [Treponema sp.]|nr:M23 family metallopeptidase [Treponema sp.]
MKKSFLITCLCLISTLSLPLFAFEWPQDNTEKGFIKSYFGQKRGKQISTSLIFANPEPVKCIEDGNVLIIMTDEQDDSYFFPSALGTCVIVSHEDSLISVYGNLDKDSVNKALTGKNYVKSGDILGEIGNTNWQSEPSSLEFQIIDTQKSSAINPKILLPRTENELPLSLGDIVVEHKAGARINLKTQKSFPSGLYRIYQKRNSVTSPYKTSITINGVVVDQISYDAVYQENNKIYVVGKKKYINSDIYPDDDYQLLGETVFTAGKSTLGLSIEDFLGKTITQTYAIAVTN